jgi:hypothetical protein
MADDAAALIDALGLAFVMAGGMALVAGTSAPLLAAQEGA